MSVKTISIVNGIVPQPDWNQATNSAADYIKNKPSPVTSLSASSTDAQYASAKAAYEAVHAVSITVVSDTNGAVVLGMSY